MREGPGKPSPRTEQFNTNTLAPLEMESRGSLHKCVTDRGLRGREARPTAGKSRRQTDRRRCEGGRDGAGTRADGSAGKAKRRVRKGGRGTGT